MTTLESQGGFIHFFPVHPFIPLILLLVTMWAGELLARLPASGQTVTFVSQAQQGEEGKSERLRWFLGSRHAAAPAFLHPGAGRRSGRTPQPSCGPLPHVPSVQRELKTHQGCVYIDAPAELCTLMIISINVEKTQAASSISCATVTENITAPAL